jgi:hypothetical protein
MNSRTFIRALPRGYGENILLEVIHAFGPLVGLISERHRDGKTRYRMRRVEGTPGVWISKDAAMEYAFNRMYGDLSKVLAGGRVSPF